MAKNDDLPMYGARVNIEHIKGYTPDSPFHRYGEESQLNSPPVLSDDTHAIKTPGRGFYASGNYFLSRCIINSDLQCGQINVFS